MHAHYYNENDPKAAAWLRELISQGCIPSGDVDGRSIHDVRAIDLEGYSQCHFFAGIGGWPLALQLAGWPEDRRVWTGSCPCQPFSVAGKGLGENDPRHLWPVWHALIRECRPPVVFGEQVASKAGREWLAGIRAQMEALGYAVGAADLCAAGVGAPHIRQRLFWVADAHVGDAGAEREQRGGELGLQQKSGGPVRLAVSDGAEWSGTVGNGDEAGSTGYSNGRGLGNSSRDDERRASMPKFDGKRLSPGGPGRASGMDDADGPRFEGTLENAEGEARNEAWLRMSGKGCGPSPWGAFSLIPCRDGKARRIEPGSFPLADGLPGRLGLLRGYGNAIVPELAKEFILAAYE